MESIKEDNERHKNVNKQTNTANIKENYTYI